MAGGSAGPAAPRARGARRGAAGPRGGAGGGRARGAGRPPGAPTRSGGRGGARGCGGAPGAAPASAPEPVTGEGEGGGAPSPPAWQALRGEWERRGWLRGCVSAGGAAGGERVAVLLSGGVDSSVALQLALAAGHRCTAFYLQIWFQEDFRNFWGECPWEEDLKFARGVCEQAGVELRVVPLTDEYWGKVVAHSLGEIRRGRTPNPDMLCNSRVKFGAFLAYLDATYPGEFTRIASGHYAQAERLERGAGGGAGGEGSCRALLRMSADQEKDQTYFLAGLSPAQVERAMFPLGVLNKTQVRGLAQECRLPTMDRKDSQGICFLGKVKFSEFVEEHLGRWPGLIVEEETGEPQGFHRGVWFHTIGQRQGLRLPNGPWYVVRKDVDTNTLYVSRHYYSEDKRRNTFLCGGFNWLGGEDARPPAGARLQCKVRHGPAIYGCTLEYLGRDSATGRVVLDGNDQGLAAGQYSVFYDKDGRCLGSAVMLGGV